MPIEGIISNPNWGVYPILLKIGNISIDSYSFFVGLGILVGLLFFYFESKKNNRFSESTFYILFSALVGGALGSKLPIWIVNYHQIIASLPDLTPLFSGRTIVGGFIGGTIAVMLTKKYLGIKEKRGNLFAPGIAIGLAIGRIGCFLRGCCYGIQTNLPWGVNFGDGILRHPTQIYESIFALGMFIYLEKAKNKNPAPGQLLKIFMISYFSFRFLIEFIRVEPVVLFGLTGYQLASLFVFGYYAITSEKVRTFINLKAFDR